MPSVRFSLASSNFLRGMHSMKFFAESTANGVQQGNCELCVSPDTPSYIELSIGLVYTDNLGLGDFDITCSVTNYTGYDVDVTLDPNDFTWDGGVAVTWSTLTETITNGSTGTAITGSSYGNFVSSALTLEGFVTAVSNPAGNGTWTSNTDSSSAP